MPGKIPYFVIGGTQKAGTTWLEHHLFNHPQVYTPRKQLHFFDKNYSLGVGWYRANFIDAPRECKTGEKTTEYLDTIHSDIVASRMAETCKDLKIIFVLRDPVERAFSALEHMVNSGLEPIPKSVDELIFEDASRDNSRSFRYIERGFYEKQLRSFFKYIPREQILVLILEDDIIRDPEAGWDKVCKFLEIDYYVPRNLGKPINRLRLSKVAIKLSAFFYRVPFARGVIRRLDAKLGLRKWKPEFDIESRKKLASLYSEENQRLYELLGYRISAWSGSNNE